MRAVVASIVFLLKLWKANVPKALRFNFNVFMLFKRGSVARMASHSELCRGQQRTVNLYSELCRGQQRTVKLYSKLREDLVSTVQR